MSKTASNNINEILNIADSVDVLELNNNTISHIIDAFHSKQAKNNEMRSLFPEQPEKFLSTEVDLNESIQQIGSISAFPMLYPFLMDSGALKSLVKLLFHENDDIVTTVLDALNELTDSDVISELSGSIKADLSTILAASKLPIMMIRNILPRYCGILSTRSDGEDEFNDATKSITSALSILENLIELDSTTFCTKDFLSNEQLLKWLLNHLKHDPVTIGFSLFNRSYCSELLCMIIQASGSATTLMSSKGAIDRMLKVGMTSCKLCEDQTQFSSPDPLEIEIVRNVFNALNIIIVASIQNSDLGEILMEKDNDEDVTVNIKSVRQAFCSSQGIELLVRLLYSTFPNLPFLSLRTLSHLLTAPFASLHERKDLFAQEIADRIIQCGGIKPIFSLFISMGDGSANSRIFAKSQLGSSVWRKEVQHSSGSYLALFENAVGLLCGLVKCSSSNSTCGDRLMAKFLEQRGAKVERLLDIHSALYKSVNKIRSNRRSDLKQDERTNEDLYLEECNAGLIILQAVDEILMRLVCSGIEALSNRVLSLADERGVDVQCSIVEEIAQLVLRMDKSEVQTEIGNISSTRLSIRDEYCQLGLQVAKLQRDYREKFRGEVVVLEQQLLEEVENEKDALNEEVDSKKRHKAIA